MAVLEVVTFLFGVSQMLLGLLLNLWIVSSIIGVLIGVQILRGINSKKNGIHVPLNLLNYDSITKEIKKILPVSLSTGWRLLEVQHSKRIWEHSTSFAKRHTSVTRSNKGSLKFLATSSKVDLLPQEIISTLVNPQEFFCWYPGIPPPLFTTQPAEINPQVETDEITLTVPPLASPELWQTLLQSARNALHYVSKGHIVLPNVYRTGPVVVRLTRRWSTQSGYMFCQPKDPISVSILGYYWIWYSFTRAPIEEEMTSFGSILALPVPGNENGTCLTLTSHLSALMQHLVEKRGLFFRPLPSDSVLHFVKVRSYSSAQSANRVSATTGVDLPDGHFSSKQPHQRERSRPTADNRTRTNRVSPPPADSSDASALDQTEQDQTPFTPFETFPPSVTQHSYSDKAREAVQRHLEAAFGSEEDGWTVINVTKGVTIMKRTPGPSEPPLNCVKGTATIHVPPDYVLKYLLVRENAQRLDPLLKDSVIIEELDKFTRVANLMYHPVRPTTARDFCILSITSRADQVTRTFTATSITHPDCPEQKGFVRAEVVVGGYVLRDHPTIDGATEATYVTQVDLKGRVPSFVVNKVSSSQPLRVEKLREAVEPVYREALINESLMEANFSSTIPAPPADVSRPLQQPIPEGQEVFEDRTLSEPVNLSTENHVSSALEHTPPEGGNLTHPLTIPGEQVNSARTSSSQQKDVQEAYTPDELSSSDEDTPSQKLPENPVFEKVPWKCEPGTPSTVSSLAQKDSLISWPVYNNEVDFKTMGNQVAASVYEEAFNASSVDVTDPTTFTYGDNGWTFVNFEKDVVILRKKMAGSPFDCFMGKGLIPLSPLDVFQQVRNPTLRFSYDNMLKEVEFIRKISDDLYILHLVHETTHCLVKQARDFCMLVSERAMGEQYMLVGTSVEIPECPPNSNMRRGKVLTSGWLFEPVATKDGKVYTLITYIVQVDLGALPAVLMNLLSKRQPLCIAYLRDYLTGHGTLSASLYPNASNR